MCVCCDVMCVCLAALILFNNVSLLIYFNKAQSESRPLWGLILLCLQQCARNFSSIYSARPIEAALPRIQGGKQSLHVQFCKLDCVSALSFSSCSSHTLAHKNTLNEHSYRLYKLSESEPRGFKAWPTNIFKKKVSPNNEGVIDQQAQQNKHTLFNPYSLVSPVGFQSLIGSVSESREVTATTWRLKI